MPIFKTRKLFIKYFKVNWGVTYFVLKVFIFSKKEHMLPVKIDSRYSVKEKKVTKINFDLSGEKEKWLQFHQIFVHQQFVKGRKDFVSHLWRKVNWS